MVFPAGNEKTEGLDLLSAVFLLSGPLLLIDRDGRVKSLNGAFVKLLGYSAAGAPFSKFCRNERSAASFLESLAKEGRASECLDLSAADGSVIPARVSGSQAGEGFAVAFDDLRGKKALEEELRSVKDELKRRADYQEDFREGVFHMLRDLDSSERELETAYEKLKETQAQLIQSSKMTALGELAAGVAHELSQPLTVVKGLSHNILRDFDASSAPYDKLRLIAEASGKMELVIRHLKIFSRTDGPALTPVDLNRVIKDAFVIAKEVLANSSIKVKMSLSEVPPVLGSPNRLEQVVINLVTNARDAMQEGGTLEISTGMVERGRARLVRMSFRDSGCGIPKNLIGRIFDPFFTTKEIGKGTGLGLSISYGIIKEHHGEITVESEQCKGTVFHVTLPPLT